MFIIYTRQILELENIAMVGFLTLMCKFIKENYPETLSIEEKLLKTQIKEAVDEARKFGFQYEMDIEDYLFIKWLYPEMKEQPLSENILNIMLFKDRSPQKKISMMERALNRND
jgi:hypothetical protein